MILFPAKFIALLQKEAGPKKTRILLLGAMSGVFEALSVVFINMAVVNIATGGGPDFQNLGLFLVSLLLYFYGDRQVTTHTLQMVGRTIYNTNVRIVDKVRRAGLKEFEELETSRIYAALTDNTDIIIEATRYLAEGISNVVMVAITAAYIAFISAQAFFLVFFMDLVGLSVFVLAQNRLVQELALVRDMRQGFIAMVNHVIRGFKEVKMSRARSDDLIDNFVRTRSDKARDLKIATEVRVCNIFLNTRAFFIGLVACVVFVLPQFFVLDISVITSVVALVLFSFGPLMQVLLGIPFFAKAELAVTTIDELEARLDAMDDTRQTAPDSRIEGNRTFANIELQEVTFAYSELEGKRSFTLGPLSLTIPRNELLMIHGGNGSGKSTLLKLIAGLYYPQQGRVLLDGAQLTQSNYEHYRNLFSTIHSDFHLFDRLYGQPDVDAERLRVLLDTMSLSDHTAYVDGRFTNLKLSTGQRKRLALATAALEDRPVLLFDEASSDLDPEFRRYFYETYLPELKSAGRTIVVVTHDDRFFDTADRLLRMEYGQLRDRV